MSKKMMKRSLALGALMAFVITGSAMAADYAERQVVDGGSYDGKSFTVESTGVNYGGAIYNTGTLTINNSALNSNVLKENSSYCYGGAIYNADGAKLNITGTSFEYNHTKNTCSKNGQGGAIYNAGGELTISGGTFKGNVAQGVTADGEIQFAMGGAIYNGGSGSLTVTGTTFEENKGNEGGAIVTNGGHTVITDSTFKNNEASIGGGAINIQPNKTVTLNGINTFENNKAVEGGAVKLYGTSVLDINGTATFTGNTANGVANDIYNDGTVNINEGAVVTLNGGMNGNGTTKVDGTLVLGNDSSMASLASNNGSIVKAEGAEKVTLTLTGLKDNPDTDKNEATGTALNGNVKATFTDVDLVINSEGTAIYNQDVTIASDSDVTINAKQQGISAYGDVEIEAKNVTIESVDNGIQSVADKSPNDVGNVSIKAVADENGEGGSVSIKATTEGYAVTNVSPNGGKISIEGKNVTLISENRTAVKVGHELGTEGYDGTLNVTGETITVEGAAQNPANGNERKGSAVYAQGGTLNLNATTKLTITDTGKAGGNAIGAYDGSTISVDGGKETEINGTAMARATGDDTVTVNIKGNTINVNAIDDYGIYAANNDRGNIDPSGKAVINLGDENTKKININDAYIGIYIGYNGSEVNINGAETGSELNIEDKDGDSYAGIWILNGNTVDEDTSDNAKLVIDKNTKTTIDMYKEDAEGNRTENGYAICNSSEGIVQIEGDLTVYAKNAIYTRGEAVTEINKNGGSVVAINGDIMYGEGVAGDVLDAKVLINLDSADSYLKGNIYTTNADEVRDDSLTEKVDNMTLALSNNAQWTTDAASFVNELTLNDGIVNVVEGSEGAVTVDKVTGAGGTINVDNATANQVVIGEKVAGNDEKQPVLTVATTNQELSLEDLADVAVMSTSTNEEVVVAADYVAKTDGTVYELEKAAVNSDGSLGDTEKVVDAGNLSANDMAAVGLMSWRAEMNDMNKRMGELRNANGDLGVWVRMVCGESEYNSVKNQYNQYQLGYDEKLSVDKRWTVGAALSYTDAENNFAQGSGESTNKALSIYGSKLNADGTFVDLIAKYARLENEFDIVSGMGDADYSTNGYSFSAEFGKRIQQGKGLWIEPQVELTYGKVSAVDYVTANGVNVAQDGMESLVGRVGFSLGKDVKGGNVYARASYLYDFEGETQATLDNDAVLKQDLGGGWWEVGVGANINLSKATYIYADVEKTFGGEVDTNWQWNLGVRYSF